MDPRIANRPAELTPVVRTRFSPRAYTARVVTAGELERMFEAARWAPSCYNDQPWHFVYARKEEAAAFANILAALVPFNQAWAGQASVVGFAVARATFAQNGKPNGWAHYDTGAAMANLTAQATSEGLTVHQMGGFDPAKAREVLGLPEGYEPAAAFAIGEAAPLAALPPEVAEKEGQLSPRKERSEFVFQGRWGQA
jgi:nitroreductase